MTTHDRRTWLARTGRIALGLGLICAWQGARTQPSDRVIRITSKKFEFTPSEITLKKGEPVVLELVAEDEPMGFRSRSLGLRSDIVPGRPARLAFTPDKAGKFTFFCGDGHEDMDGTIIVVE